MELFIYIHLSFTYLRWLKKTYVCEDSVSCKSLYSRQVYPLYQQLSVYYIEGERCLSPTWLGVTALRHLSSLLRDLPQVFVSIVDM